MKKSLLLFLSILSIMLFATSCGGPKGASESNESNESNETEEVKGVKYENADFGYSAVMPEGFTQQNNDAEMEKSRGGKLFLHKSCMIDFTATKMDYMGSMTPEASAKQCLEFAKVGYNDPEDKLMEAKMLDDVSYLVKAQDSFGLRAEYQTQQNGNKYTIDFTYPADMQEQFDKDVEAVVKSFKLK